MNDPVIVTREDGFVFITKLCQQANRLFKNWYSLKQSRRMIRLVAQDLDVTPESLVNSVRGGCNQSRGTWVHPLLLTNIGQWLSGSFSIKISRWVEEWKESNPDNTAKYNQGLQDITADDSKKDNAESLVQIRLQEELGGEIEVETDFGFIDLLTKDEIIEIKLADNWKHGMGHVLAYSKFYPSHKKRLHLFAHEQEDPDIIEFCRKYKITVTYDNSDIPFVTIESGQDLCKLHV